MSTRRVIALALALALASILPIGRSLHANAQEPPPGEYTYDEAKQYGLPTPTEPSEVGLTQCSLNREWTGYETPEAAEEGARQADALPICVPNPHGVLVSVGRTPALVEDSEVTSSGYRWSGAKTKGLWRGAQIIVEVGDPDVNHVVGQGEEFATAWSMAHIGGNNDPFTQAGWMEASFRTNSTPEMFTYTSEDGLDTSTGDYYLWFTEYPLNVGSYYHFRSRNCTVSGVQAACNYTLWDGAWVLLNSVTSFKCVKSGESNCRGSQFLEVFNQPSDADETWPGLYAPVDGRGVNFEGSYVFNDGGGITSWTKGNVPSTTPIFSDPYVTCWTRQYDYFRVGRDSC